MLARRDRPDHLEPFAQPRRALHDATVAGREGLFGELTVGRVVFHALRHAGAGHGGAVLERAEVALHERARARRVDVADDGQPGPMGLVVLGEEPARVGERQRLDALGRGAETGVRVIHPEHRLEQRAHEVAPALRVAPHQLFAQEHLDLVLGGDLVERVEADGEAPCFEPERALELGGRQERREIHGVGRRGRVHARACLVIER